MTRDRLLLIPLLLWCLAMVAPDLLRVVHPLNSVGFYANNDGLIYDVTGPFAGKESSPAWHAGLREGDQIDLSRLKNAASRTLPPAAMRSPRSAGCNLSYPDIPSPST